MSNRTIRINELVQRELNAILHQRYQSETIALTIMEVRVSPDLRDARVFVSVIGDEEKAAQMLRWLRAKAPEIRREIGRRIVLKFLPKFEYRLDPSVERSTRLVRILDEIGTAPTVEPPAQGNISEPS